MGSFQHKSPSCASSPYANRLTLAGRSFLVCGRETMVDVSGCVSLVITAPLTGLFQVIGCQIRAHSTTYQVCFIIAKVDGWDAEAGRGVHHPCFEPGGGGGIQEKLGRSRVDPVSIRCMTRQRLCELRSSSRCIRFDYQVSKLDATVEDGSIVAVVTT